MGGRVSCHLSRAGGETWGTGDRGGVWPGVASSTCVGAVSPGTSIRGDGAGSSVRAGLAGSGDLIIVRAGLGECLGDAKGVWALNVSDVIVAISAGSSGGSHSGICARACRTRLRRRIASGSCSGPGWAASPMRCPWCGCGVLAFQHYSCQPVGVWENTEAKPIWS